MDETVVSVDFHAANSGIAPMTWGQRTIWKPIKEYGEHAAYFNMSWVERLPAGTALAAVLDALRYLVSGNQALRSHFRDTPDGPWQDVRAGGTLAVPVAEADPQRLAERLAADRFRHDDEWPIRLAVSTTAGCPASVIFVLSHLAVDGWGLAVLIEEFRARLAGSVVERPWQPLDQATLECSPDGRRGAEAALAHWRERLSVLPGSMFDFPASEPEQLRYQQLRLDSPALAVAAELLATGCRVSTSSVLLAATSVALAALSGRPTSALKLIVSNRNDPRRKNLVAALAQNGLFVLPPADAAATMTDVIRRCHRHGLAAYARARYDPADLDALIAELALRRGIFFDLNAYFNDARGEDRWPEVSSAGTTEAELAALREDTVVSHESAYAMQDATFFLTVKRSPDKAVLSLLADTARIPLPTIELVLRAVETLLVEAAFRPVPMTEVRELTGLRQPDRTEWWPAGPGWVRPSAMTEVLLAASGARQAAVFAAPGGDERVAYLATDHLATDPADALESLHRKVITLLDGRTDAMAPDRYVLCAAPAGESTVAAWQASTPLAAGSGRPPAKHPELPTGR